MKISLNLTDSLNELLQIIEKKEGQVVAAASEAINKASAETFDMFKANLEKHKDSGNAVKSLFKHPIKIDGNEIYGLVGSFNGKNQAGYWHAAYQEYGAFRRSNNTVTFKADPWKRPVEDVMKKKFRMIVQDSLQRRLGT